MDQMSHVVNVKKLCKYSISFFFLKDQIELMNEITIYLYTSCGSVANRTIVACSLPLLAKKLFALYVCVHRMFVVMMMTVVVVVDADDHHFILLIIRLLLVGQ